MITLRSVDGRPAGHINAVDFDPVDGSVHNRRTLEPGEILLVLEICQVLTGELHHGPGWCPGDRVARVLLDDQEMYVWFGWVTSIEGQLPWWFEVVQ